MAASGDALFLDVDHAGAQPLVALTEATFSRSGDVIQFVKDPQGAIIQLLIQTVEGEEKAIRKPGPGSSK